MGKIDPGAYRAMSALDQYVTNSSIDAPQQELIRIRASQINGCAYCVNLHSQDALKLGEAFHRVNLVSAWKESGDIFSSEEQLLLAMTEEITLIHKQGLSEILYEKAISVFGEKKTAQIIMTIIAVNAWNRIGVGLRMRPEIQEDKKRKEIVHS
jgi:AhpD family alkylhydroperoxidase